VPRIGGGESEASSRRYPKGGTEMKIGVYFCKCGTNITEKMDSDKVEKDVRALPGVACFKSCEYLCSEEGKTFLEQDLKDEKPDRVVIST
jgi:heterodisulfide reductase subunit A